MAYPLNSIVPRLAQEPLIDLPLKLGRDQGATPFQVGEVEVVHTVVEGGYNEIDYKDCRFEFLHKQNVFSVANEFRVA